MTAPLNPMLWASLGSEHERESVGGYYWNTWNDLKVVLCISTYNGVLMRCLVWTKWTKSTAGIHLSICWIELFLNFNVMFLQIVMLHYVEPWSYTNIHGGTSRVSVIPGCVRWGPHGAEQFGHHGLIHLHCSTVGLRAQHNAKPYWRLPREAASASSCHVRSRRPSDGSAHTLPPRHKGSACEEGSVQWLLIQVNLKFTQGYGRKSCIQRN